MIIDSIKEERYYPLDENLAFLLIN